MSHSVAVFGGGIGGLTAAHELARVSRRRADITVYERNPVAGGKARSHRKPGSATPGRELLPGEHGFRFFPGYYRHVIRTMQQIPYPPGGPGATVADNLVEALETHFARTTGEAVEIPNRFPRSLRELAEMFSFGSSVDISMEEGLRFANRLREIICACDDRRYHEFERISWFDLLEADDASDDFRKFLADGLNQRTVAASGDQVSARSVGLTLIRIMNDWLHPGHCIDRVLNGPTTDRWIEPWRNHLVDLGVKFEFDTTLVGLDWSVDDGVQRATVVDEAGNRREVLAQSYVVALPMADARRVFETSAMVNDHTGLGGFGATEGRLEDNWMNGIQFYLDGELDLANGHTIFADSAFSLTSISQRQFWKGVDFERIGDGTVQGILSVDISDWNKPCACHGRTAKQMTREEVKDEVWAQVCEHVASSYPDQVIPGVVDWHLDPAIVELPAPDPRTGERLQNREGLFINTVNSWANRPEAMPGDLAGGGLANLFLASDYVRTNTDLATMEGANEAGRRAARRVLERMGEPKSVRRSVELFDFPEPLVFKPRRVADDVFYNAPQDLDGELPDRAEPPRQRSEHLPDAW